VLEGVFQRFHGDSFAELARMCAPALDDVVHQEQIREELPFFANLAQQESKVAETDRLVEAEVLEALPTRLREAAQQAVSLYRFFEQKPAVNYAPVFAALLGVVDETAKGILLKKLTPNMPNSAPEQRTWFEPYLQKVDRRMIPHYEQTARNLRKTLVYRNGVSPLGLLRSCLDYALNDNTKITGVFEALKSELRFKGGRDLLDRVTSMNDFRNTRIAHQEQPLTEAKEARKALIEWIDGLRQLWQIADGT
jgi:type III restriction enzyme